MQGLYLKSTLIYLQSKSTPFKLPHVMNLFTKKPLNASFMQNHTSEFVFFLLSAGFVKSSTFFLYRLCQVDEIILSSAHFPCQKHHRN